MMTKENKVGVIMMITGCSRRGKNVRSAKIWQFMITKTMVTKRMKTKNIIYFFIVIGLTGTKAIVSWTSKLSSPLTSSSITAGVLKENSLLTSSCKTIFYGEGNRALVDAASLSPKETA